MGKLPRLSALFSMAAAVSAASATGGISMTQDGAHREACETIARAFREKVFDLSLPPCRRHLAFLPNRTFPGISFPSRTKISVGDVALWAKAIADVEVVPGKGESIEQAKSRNVSERLEAIRSGENSLSIGDYDFDGAGRKIKVLLLTVNACHFGPDNNGSFSPIPFPIQGDHILRPNRPSPWVSGDPIEVDGVTYVTYWNQVSGLPVDTMGVRPAKTGEPTKGYLYYPDETCRFSFPRRKV